MRDYCTYILRCADGSFYVGITNFIEERFRQHQEGCDAKCYTFSRRPLELVHVERFGDVNDAIRREKQLKTWSRKKKETLIQGNALLLHEHAKKKWQPHPEAPQKRLGVDVVVQGDGCTLLLVQRCDDECWSLPGGWVEKGETPDGAAQREVQEETGLRVTLDALLDVYVRDTGSVHLTYLAHQSGGMLLRNSPEANCIAFLQPSDVHPWHRDHKERVERVMRKIAYSA